MHEDPDQVDAHHDAAALGQFGAPPATVVGARALFKWGRLAQTAYHPGDPAPQGAVLGTLARTGAVTLLTGVDEETKSVLRHLRVDERSALSTVKKCGRANAEDPEELVVRVDRRVDDVVTTD